MRFAYDTTYRDGHALLRYLPGRLAYGLLMAALLIAPWVMPKYVVGELSYVFIMCIVSLGLMVLVGYTGQVSLGHSAFIAIGAYTHTWLLANGVPLVPSMLLAAAFTGLIGLVIGLPAIRVSGLYLAMVTLAFAILTEHVIGRWKSVTGGFNGTSVNSPVLFGLDLSKLQSFYYLCLVVLVIVLKYAPEGLWPHLEKLFGRFLPSRQRVRDWADAAPLPERSKPAAGELLLDLTVEAIGVTLERGPILTIGVHGKRREVGELATAAHARSDDRDENHDHDDRDTESEKERVDFGHGNGRGLTFPNPKEVWDLFQRFPS